MGHAPRRPASRPPLHLSVVLGSFRSPVSHVCGFSARLGPLSGTLQGARTGQVAVMAARPGRTELPNRGSAQHVTNGRGRERVAANTGGEIIWTAVSSGRELADVHSPTASRCSPLILQTRPGRSFVFSPPSRALAVNTERQ